jgi:hypothetical protein
MKMGSTCGPIFVPNIFKKFSFGIQARCLSMFRCNLSWDERT